MRPSGSTELRYVRDPNHSMSYLCLEGALLMSGAAAKGKLNADSEEGGEDEEAVGTAGPLAMAATAPEAVVSVAMYVDVYKLS